MWCDENYLDWAREHGIPDPEGNARLANDLTDLVDADPYDADRIRRAREMLPGLTDTELRAELENMLNFEATCLCSRPDRPDHD